jgi:hypothetical protein
MTKQSNRKNGIYQKDFSKTSPLQLRLRQITSEERSKPDQTNTSSVDSSGIKNLV